MMIDPNKILNFRRLATAFFFLSGLIMVSLLPFWREIGVVPNFISVVVYLWTIYRPDLVSRKLFILLGICRDATMGYPIGVSVLELLLIISLTSPFRRFVIEKNFRIVFIGYVLFTTLSNCLFWLILSATKGYLLPFTGALKPIIFNLLAYPLMCQISLHMQQRIDRIKMQGFYG